MKSSAIVARPYAKAVFSLAQTQQAIPQWEEALLAGVDIVTHPDMVPLLSEPRITKNALLDLIYRIGGKSFGEQAKQLIKVLSDFDRLSYLPAILAEFIELKNAEQRRLDVRVESATALDAQTQEQLAAKLKKRFNRDINLKVNINEALISGACIYAGDQIIDGSLLGRLNRLTEKLTNTAR